MRKTPKIWEMAVVGVILLFYFSLLAEPSNFATADLGRHLKNGELFFKNLQIPDTNLYSYTYPDYPFVNHHWASGPLFYLIYKLGGFSGLSLFFIILSLAAFFIMFRLGWRTSGLAVTSATAALSIPVLAARSEIRPEVFSYLLATIFFWILWKFQQDRLAKKSLWLLPTLSLVWINLHVYFFLGGVLLLFFLLENLIRYWQQKDKESLEKTKTLFKVGLAVSAASLLNPAGLKGALYPLSIFQNYGYRLFENQSIWFLAKILSYPPSLYFKVSFGVLILSWVYAIYRASKDKTSISLALLFLSFFLSYLAWTAVRNFTLFGYFSLAITALNFRGVLPAGKRNSGLTTSSLLIAVVIIIFLLNPKFMEGQKFGFGLKKNMEKAAEFFVKEKIKGPIFNNYDIGSYLVFYLYPQERVFVENRPEAYPAQFFTDFYVPMQEKEEKWKEAEQKYGFNAIFFWRHDLTPWARQFLSSRLQDPEWAPIYLDDYSVIFLKRNEINREIILKNKLKLVGQPQP